MRVELEFITGNISSRAGIIQTAIYTFLSRPLAVWLRLSLSLSWAVRSDLDYVVASHILLRASLPTLSLRCILSLCVSQLSRLFCIRWKFSRSLLYTLQAFILSTKLSLRVHNCKIWTVLWIIKERKRERERERERERGSRVE